MDPVRNSGRTHPAIACSAILNHSRMKHSLFRIESVRLVSWIKIPQIERHFTFLGRNWEILGFLIKKVISTGKQGYMKYSLEMNFSPRMS